MDITTLPPEDLVCISSSDLIEINRLIALTNSNEINLKDLWYLMDVVWDEMGCSSTELDEQKIELYYKHPIWLLNGLFAENHDESIAHRQAIVDWVTKQEEIRQVLDFGGGTGLVARMLAKASSSLKIDVYEPFPSDYALRKTGNYKNVEFVREFSLTYDCLICTDVLEHVPDPLKLLSEMVQLVKSGGHLIIANHFYPSIKCHLPCTFFLRHTFDYFASMMGLEKVEQLQWKHIHVYHKKMELEFNWEKLRNAEERAKRLFIFNEIKNSLEIRFNKIQRLLADPRAAVTILKKKMFELPSR